MQVSIQLFLRDKTGLSRRDAGDEIKLGRVKVNGVVAEIGQKFDPTVDQIEYGGKHLSISHEDRIYLLLNKPSGFITSRNDPHNKKTVYDLIPNEYSKLFPIGRLDIDTEGLLLLTNDGDFSYRMTHPKFEIEKEYYVELNGKLSLNQIEKIERGLNNSEITTAPCKIYKHNTLDGRSVLNIILHEGQNREIKRIFSSLGFKVTKLKRLRMGNISLGDMKTGKWRLLNSDITKL